MRRWLLLILYMFATKSSAQELFVFSELALLTEPAGQPLHCDGIPKWSAHALLSPAVARRGQFTLVLAVSVPGGSPFVLDTGQNPSSSFPLKMYRIFPALEEQNEPIQVPVSFRGRVSEGQRCALFLLEVQVPASTLPGRVKLEPSLWLPESPNKDSWIRYPMEVRVVAGIQPIPPVCHFPQPTLRGLLLSGLAGLLGECPEDANTGLLIDRIITLRRQQGKNQ